MLRGKKVTPNYVEREYLSITGVAQTLGVSERLAHSLIHDPSDPIPHFRIGSKLLRVRRTDLQEWVERRRVEDSRVDRIVQEILG